MRFGLRSFLQYIDVFYYVAQIKVLNSRSSFIFKTNFSQQLIQALNTGMTISQELFDETVLENEEVFELSQDEALLETISQFRQQNVPIEKAGIIISSHPCTEKGKRERSYQSKLLSNLTFLDSIVNEDGSIQDYKDEYKVWKILNEIQKYLTGRVSTDMQHDLDSDDKKTRIIFKDISLNTLLRSDGIFTLLSFLSSPSSSILHESAACILTVLEFSSSSQEELTRTEKNDMETKIRQIKRLLTPVLPRLMNLIKVHSESDPIFIKLAIQANKGCQQNKVGLVKAGKALPILLDIITINITTKTKCKDFVGLSTHICHLLSSLCQYDDVTEMASTAHEYAQELFRHDAVNILQQLTHSVSNDSFGCHSQSNECLLKLKCAIMSAQRALAVNDEIVQSLVAEGTLETCNETLSQCLNSMTTNSTNTREDIYSLTVSTILGLFRNLCGNDDIKSTICQESLSYILLAMSKFINHAKIQEHGLATLAAMSLRRVSNANLLLQNDAIATLLRSLQKFGENEKVQRAGCLCIRNVIARQPSSIKQLIREDYPQIENVLKHAGKFRGCVDEAYAALRDLEISSELMRVEEVNFIENGSAQKKIVVKRHGVEMFGENKLNFRQAYEESNNLDERIDNLF